MHQQLRRSLWTSNNHAGLQWHSPLFLKSRAKGSPGLRGIVCLIPKFVREEGAPPAIVGLASPSSGIFAFSKEGPYCNSHSRTSDYRTSKQPKLPASLGDE